MKRGILENIYGGGHYFMVSEPTLVYQIIRFYGCSTCYARTLIT
jgi:hypothetical protein